LVSSSVSSFHLALVFGTARPPIMVKPRFRCQGPNICWLEERKSRFAILPQDHPPPRIFQVVSQQGQLQAHFIVAEFIFTLCLPAPQEFLKTTLDDENEPHGQGGNQNLYFGTQVALSVHLLASFAIVQSKFIPPCWSFSTHRTPQKPPF
jgi:hypothetical protein